MIYFILSIIISLILSCHENFSDASEALEESLLSMSITKVESHFRSDEGALFLPEDSGLFQIQNSDGFCLTHFKMGEGTAEKANVYLAECSEDDLVQWKRVDKHIAAYVDDDIHYAIDRDYHTGLAQTWRFYANNVNQFFTFNENLTITHDGTGQCLTYQNATHEGNTISFAPCDDSVYQTWYDSPL